MKKRLKKLKQDLNGKYGKLGDPGPKVKKVLMSSLYGKFGERDLELLESTGHRLVTLTEAETQVLRRVLAGWDGLSDTLSDALSKKICDLILVKLGVRTDAPDEEVGVAGKVPSLKKGDVVWLWAAVQDDVGPEARHLRAVLIDEFGRRVAATRSLAGEGRSWRR